MRTVSKSHLSSSPAIYRPIQRLSRIGIWVSSAAFLLNVTVVGYMAGHMIAGSNQFTAILIDDLGLTGQVSNLTALSRTIGAVLWASVDILGAILLWQSRLLFAGYLDGGVFSLASTRRLRLIGLLVLSLGPVSILSELVAGLVISAMQGNGLHASLSIDDGDIYAIVIGLVITAASHIMVEAARLSEENQAFV